MDGHRFDDLTRGLARVGSRRSLFKVTAAAIGAAFAGRHQDAGAQTCREVAQRCTAARPCCAGLNCVGTICVPAPGVPACLTPGQACPSARPCCVGTTCAGGVCCPAPLACGGACCANGTLCQNGICQSPTGGLGCPTGQTNCGGAGCRNLSGDPNNCGSCGRVCPSGVCASGVCLLASGVACTGGGQCVSGNCVDGVCCAAANCAGVADACNDGVCQAGSGQCGKRAKVDGLGCETGNACAPSGTCLAGACTPSSTVICPACQRCDPGSGCVADDTLTCGDGFVCRGGVCDTGCSASQRLCNGVCIGALDCCVDTDCGGVVACGRFVCNQTTHQCEIVNDCVSDACTVRSCLDGTCHELDQITVCGICEQPVSPCNPELGAQCEPKACTTPGPCQILEGAYCDPAQLGCVYPSTCSTCQTCVGGGCVDNCPPDTFTTCTDGQPGTCNLDTGLCDYTSVCGECEICGFSRTCEPATDGTVVRIPISPGFVEIITCCGGARATVDCSAGVCGTHLPNGSKCCGSAFEGQCCVGGTWQEGICCAAEVMYGTCCAVDEVNLFGKCCPSGSVEVCTGFVDVCCDKPCVCPGGAGGACDCPG